MKKNLTLLLIVISLLAAALSGCGTRQNNTNSVLILAAASTRDAVEEIAAEFAKEHDINVKVSAASSSRLAAQIVNGAPADLFLSANVKWADHVKDKGFAAKSRLLLGNRLVLVVPKGNPARVMTPDDLTKENVQRVALAGPKVPAGIYARQALSKLKLLDQLQQQKKIVAGEDVRVTLSYVERGEADAGVVYATDAQISEKVKVVYKFPEKTHDPIRYALVLLKDANNNQAAQAFYDFLGSDRVTGIFKKYGFAPLTP